MGAVPMTQAAFINTNRAGPTVSLIPHYLYIQSREAECLARSVPVGASDAEWMFHADGQTGGDKSQNYLDDLIDEAKRLQVEAA